MMSIMVQNLIAHKTKVSTEVMEQIGFLIYDFTTEEARIAVKDKHNFICLVSEEDGNLIGYTLGCNIKKLEPAYQETLTSASLKISDIIISDKVFYHRHIAKKTNKKNIGKELLHALLGKVKETGYKYIICQIAEKPIQNKVSKAIHEKCGFVCVGYHQSDEVEFGIYIKEIQSY